MHEVIRIICYANNKIEARERAETIFNKSLVGEGATFDYGTFFDDETSSMSGQARFGKLPAVCSADSIEGKKLIQDGMKYTKESFFENLKRVRRILQDYEDDCLFEEELTTTKGKVLDSLTDGKANTDLFMFKYLCSSLGQYRGSKIYLYDDSGEGIRSNKDLRDVLTKFTESKKIWVIPIDVHY